MQRIHGYLPSRRGFTLIEIVLSVGIISFALVGILGLFPVALENATKSQEETQAALIARSVYTDLVAKSDPQRFVLTGSDTTGELQRKDVDLKIQGDHYLAYDLDALPIGAIGAGEYNSGKSDATYLVRVSVQPLEPASTKADGLTGLSHIAVTVEMPANAARDKRTAYLFASQIRQGAEQRGTSN